MEADEAAQATNLVDVIPRSAGKIPLLTQPVSLDFHLEATLDHRVARKLSQRALWEFVNLYTGR